MYVEGLGSLYVEEVGSFVRGGARKYLYVEEVGALYVEEVGGFVRRGAR